MKFSIDVNGCLRYQMVRKIAENFNRLSRSHERYRQTDGGRATAYRERELTLTSAKNPAS